MKIRFKLFATLMHYLPDDADGHEVLLEVDDTTTAYDIIERFGITREEAYLVLVNGVFLCNEERAKPLRDGDTLAIWPPVAGG